MSVKPFDKRYTLWQECNGQPVKNRLYSDKEAHEIPRLVPVYIANNAAAAIRALAGREPEAAIMTVCTKIVEGKKYQWKLKRTV